MTGTDVPPWLAVVGCTARGAGFAGLAAMAVWLGPNVAQASNANKPRTQAVFNGVPCLTEVDRSVDPVLHVDLAIPFEDLGLGADELPDSRTFQLFALCRDHHQGEPLPNWVNSDDAMRAMASGILDVLPMDSEILEASAAWATGHDGAAGTCVQVMNPTRMPISCPATESGVDWDTQAAPAGNYVIRAHTFEPIQNKWTARPGLVRLIDGDPDAVGPAVVVMSPQRLETQAFEDAEYRILGCAAGAAGTQVELSWAPISTADLDDPAAWEVFASFEYDAASPSFDIAFDPPIAAENQAVVIRAIATDPMSRTWTSHALGKLIVYPGQGEPDPPEIPDGPDFCAEPIDPTDGSSTTSGGDTGGESSAGSGSAGADAGDGGREGCGCRASRRHRRFGSVTALLLLLGCRRRRWPRPR